MLCDTMRHANIEILEKIGNGMGIDAREIEEMMKTKWRLQIAMTAFIAWILGQIIMAIVGPVGLYYGGGSINDLQIFRFFL